MSNQNNTRYNGKTDASKLIVTKLICNYNKTLCFTIEDLINSFVVSTFAELVARLAVPGYSGIIYLNSGTFAVTQALTIPDNISLVGSGPGTILNVTTNIGATFLTLGSNCMIKDLSIDINSVAGVSAITIADEKSNILLSNLLITDTGAGVYAINTGVDNSNIRILNIVLDGFDTGISISSTCDRVYIIGNTITNGSNETITSLGTNIIINNNKFISCDTIVNRTDGQNVIISNNVSTTGGNVPILIDDSTANAPNMLINSNTFEVVGSSSILIVDPGSADFRNTIFNNNICKPSATGLSAFVYNGATITNPANISVIDNLIPSATAITDIFSINVGALVPYHDTMVRQTSSYFSFTSPVLGRSAMSPNSISLTNPGALAGTLTAHVRGPSTNLIYISVTANSCSFDAVNCLVTSDTAFFPAVNTITAGNKALFMFTGYGYIRIS